MGWHPHVYTESRRKEKLPAPISRHQIPCLLVSDGSSASGLRGRRLRSRHGLITSVAVAPYNMPWRHRGWTELWPYSVWISGLDWGGWKTPYPSCCTPRK